MRCTNSICRSGNTELIQRNLSIDVGTGKDGGRVLYYKIDDVWLCNSCGNPFHPFVSICRSKFRYRANDRPSVSIISKKAQRVIKKELLEDLFRDLHFEIKHEKQKKIDS